MRTAHAPLAGLLAGRGLLCLSRPKRFVTEGKKKDKNGSMLIFLLYACTGASRGGPGMTKEGAKRPAGGRDGPVAARRGRGRG